MDANEIIERRACITGVGQSEIGRRLFRDPLELTEGRERDAALAAGWTRERVRTSDRVVHVDVVIGRADAGQTPFVGSCTNLRPNVSTR